MCSSDLVFPKAGNQRLGASCVQLCGAGSTTCSGQAGPAACQSRSTDLRSARDVVGAGGQWLISAGLQSLAGGTSSFQVPQVNRDADLPVVARFQFGPLELLGVMRQLADQAVQQLQVGQSPQFAIPYQLQGAAWLDVGSLEIGRAHV